jgi:hypothetical protein
MKKAQPTQIERLSQSREIERLTEKVIGYHEEVLAYIAGQKGQHAAGDGNEGISERLARVEEMQIENGAARMQALETTIGVSRWWLGTAIAVAAALGAVFNAVWRYIAGSE